MKGTEEILRRVEAGEISVDEAQRLIEAISQRPRDDARERALKCLANELDRLEKIELEAKVYSVDNKIAQWLAGGDWLPTSKPICIAYTELLADGKGSFATRDGHYLGTIVEGSREKFQISLSCGQVTSLWTSGLFGTNEQPVFVEITVNFTPSPRHEPPSD